MRRLLAGITLAFVVHGSAKTQTFQLMGAGVQSCGTWIANRQLPDTTLYQISIEWVLGFLSGAGYSGSVDPLHGLDVNAIAGWMDSYCQAHPLEKIADAAEALAQAPGPRPEGGPPPSGPGPESSPPSSGLGPEAVPPPSGPAPGPSRPPLPPRRPPMPPPRAETRPQPPRGWEHPHWVSGRWLWKGRGWVWVNGYWHR
jgi:hypothetical protein